MNNIIVSLTSYKERLPFLSMTLNSIYKQKMQPDKIVLVLYNEDVKYIPLSIKKDIESGRVELIVCDEDLKSHKKYYYTMLKYPDDIVITIDDDLIYDDDLVSSLISYYEKYPTCISARRVHRIKKGEKYINWDFEYDKILEPSMDLFATTGAGTLFPPNILRIDELNKDDIYACINADDVLLKHIEYKLGINTVWVKNEKQHPVKNKLCLFFSKQLSTFNVDKGGNDYYLSKFKCYE
jgi:hypothetical protein